jgi:hypothetical protein
VFYRSRTMGEQVSWQGVGRWLSFAAAALLIIVAIPNFATNDAAVGWNIFLGLLLFGAVASGYRRAPLLLLVLLGLMVLRLLVALTVERNVIEAVADGVLLILLFFGWQDLRRQSALIDENGPTQEG